MAAYFIDSSTHFKTLSNICATSSNSIHNSAATNQIGNVTATDSDIESIIIRYLYQPNTPDVRRRLEYDLNVTCGSLYNTDNSTPTYIEYSSSNSTVYLNNCTYISGGGISDYFSLPPIDPVERKKYEFREKIRNQLIFTPKTSAQPIRSVKENEAIAMETLREMITEEEFKRFINRGFITVRGQSGKTYQIFRNSWHTRVWVGGQLIEEVCVRIRTDVNAPATDNLIAFKAMIETDEEEFRKIGNVYKFKQRAA